MEQDAGLKLIYIGVVAVDKKVNEEKIKVFPVQKLIFEDGKVDDTEEEEELTAVNIEGVSAKAVIKRSKVIEAAKWLANGDDGRQTPPDVINGETVKIYKFADSKVYFWTTMMREPELRRLEHVVHAYSNLREGRSAFGLDSSYGQMFSTRDKRIRIWTSVSDGEKYSYEFLIDTEESLYRMVDNIKNGFGFESKDTRVWMNNASNSYIELVKEIMTAKVGDTINLIAGNKLYVNTPMSHFTGQMQVDKTVRMGENLHVSNLIYVPDIILSGRSLVGWLNTLD